MSQKIKIFIFVILHFVGIIGFTLPVTRTLFIKIIPLHLLIITIILFFDDKKINILIPAFLITASVIGFFAEWLGVNYGVLFGNYAYSELMAPSLQGVPFVIGILWAGLALATNHIGAFVLKQRQVLLHALFAATLMCAFDFILEPFAIKFGLWHWSTGTIPIFNYITWWAVSFIISLIYQFFFNSSKQTASVFYLGCQAVFLITVLALNQ